MHLTVKKSHGRTCCLFSYQRQHRTIASASLRRLFAPLLQFEKPEIHTGFLRFPSFELEQKSCLRLLAELRGAVLKKVLEEECNVHFPDKHNAPNASLYVHIECMYLLNFPFLFYFFNSLLPICEVYSLTLCKNVFFTFYFAFTCSKTRIRYLSISPSSSIDV